TTNLKDTIQMNQLMKKINQTLIAEGDAFKKEAIRTRAVEVTDYFIADGSDEAAAFVHVTMKIAKGRTEEIKQAAVQHVYQAMEEHVRDIKTNHYFAIS